MTSDADLAAYAQANGNDILFTDSDAVTKLSHEIEKFVKATGELVAWVKVPSVSSTADTVLYMYYGNPSAPNQQDAINVWDANYKAVWHLREDPTGPAPQFVDSSSNPNNGTGNDLDAGSQTAGQIDGSLNFLIEGSHDDYVQVPDNVSLRLAADMTISAWVNTSSSDYQSRLVVNKWKTGPDPACNGGTGDCLNYWLGKLWDGGVTPANLHLGFYVDGGSQYVWAPWDIADDSWHYVVGVADAAGGRLRLYVDGSQVSTVAYTGTSQTGNWPLRIGHSTDNLLQYWDGGIDEPRVSASARSAGWISTEFNNQGSPSTFYTLSGAEAPPSSCPTPTPTSALTATATPTWTPTSTAIPSTQKIVLAGEAIVGNSDFAAARYNSSGVLDATFATGGKVNTNFVTYDYGIDMALQADGKYVMAGRTQNGSTFDFALLRYNADGTLDSGFGTGGKVITSITSGDDYGMAVAIQSDGKIVAAGFGGSGVGFAVVRYNANGTLDVGFGTGGIVTTSISGGSDQAYDVVIQPDGKIILAGGSSGSFALVRYNADGTLDSSFGSGGIVTSAVGSGSASGRAVVLQADGKIVVPGYSYAGSYRDFAVARYNSNGTLDTANFGSPNGWAVTSLSSDHDEAYAVAIQSDGKIIAGGYVKSGSNEDFALIRYNTNGSLDTANFGSPNGWVITHFAGASDRAQAVAIQSDGRIVAGGCSTVGTFWDFALARYYPDGSLDASFGAGGKVTTDFGGSNDEGFALGLQ